MQHYHTGHPVRGLAQHESALLQVEGESPEFPGGFVVLKVESAQMR